MVKIGSDTVIGRIATLADELDSGDTANEKEMSHLINMLLVFSTISGLGLLAIAFGLGYDRLTAILFLITIMVENAPDGLICVTTVSV